MKSVNYNHLYNFYHVAKSGSLKTAALNLGLTQSTLSEQLKALETHLGQKLFSRVGRNLSLNTQGRRLFGRVEPLFSAELDLDNLATDKNSSSRTAVVIGITTAISKAFAFEILRPIFRQSKTTVRVVESDPDSLLKEFKKAEIDVFITHEKLSRSLIKKLKSLPILSPSLALVASRKYQSLMGIPLDKLSGHPFFLFTVRSQIRWESEAFFKAKKIAPEIIGEVDDPEIIKAAVLDDLGLAILPENIVAKEIEVGQVIRFARVQSPDLQIFAHYQGGDLPDEIQQVVRVLEENGSV